MGSQQAGASTQQAFAAAPSQEDMETESEESSATSSDDFLRKECNALV